MFAVSTAAFKAYDVRGRLPDELNSDIAYRIGRAYAEYLEPGEVVVGHDIRLSSPELARAAAEGLIDGGSSVIDIGMVGTEEVYFATAHLKTGGGIMVTASHNPAEYNGMKMVRAGAQPVSGDTGLDAIRDRVAGCDYRRSGDAGRYASRTRRVDMSAAFAQHLLRFIDTAKLRPLRIVVNPGNGAAGHMVEALADHLPFEFVWLHAEPDGRFPNGIPNPLLPENREVTRAAVRAHEADLGVAWDGDADRCFVFDEHGECIEGYYVVGLLAQAFLKKDPGARIIHDPRLTWNTIELVRESGGVPVLCKTGHAFIKERMRREDAVYGGEMSAHHYFRDFAYCDSGMLPWLLVAELICSAGQPLSAMVAARQARFPISGEINVHLADAKRAVQAVLDTYAGTALREDFTDGISLEFDRWRFNLRSSNTEPVVRLNVESRGDPALVASKTEEILSILKEQS
jgi:phosphomannomutase/phosphomannomutase/phosphoglucomutase